MSNKKINETTISKNLINVWNGTDNFTTPSILTCYCQHKWYLVLDDSKSVIRFLGKSYGLCIYMAVKSKCTKVKTESGNYVYTILDKDALQIVSRHPMDPIDNFGIGELAPAYWENIATTPLGENSKEEEEEEEEEEELPVNSPIKKKTPHKKL